MSHHTAELMAAFSHGGNILILPPIVAAGLAAWYFGRMRSGAPGQPGPRILHRTSVALVYLLCLTFLVSLLHIGCATLKAHDTICLSNEKRLLLGLLQYSQDYDETLPPAGIWPDVAKARAPKSEDDPSRDPLSCPAATTRASYAMDAALASTPIASVDAPSDTVLLFEADAPPHALAGGIADVATRRHEGGSNIGFADGHARRTNPTRLNQYVWVLPVNAQSARTKR